MKKKGWVMVDPTWENTTGGVDYFNKLDLNHFVFAIKGSSSSSPVPAGSYKYGGYDSKDVKVTLSENDFLGKPQIGVSIDVPQLLLAGFPNKVKIKVTNAGNALLPSQSLTVVGSNTDVVDGENQVLGAIPAFGSADFEFDLRTKSIFDSYSDTILVLIGGQKFTKDIEIKPFLLFKTIPIAIIVAVASMVLIYMLVLTGHLYKSRKK